MGNLGLTEVVVLAALVGVPTLVVVIVAVVIARRTDR